MPREIEAGYLYVSLRFGAAAHICPCGCGNKVQTPLSQTDWSFTETATGPTLLPSIGNWQFPCRSHYWLEAGAIIWAGKWSEGQITAGREAELQAAASYFAARASLRSGGVLRRLWRWISSKFVSG